MTLIDCKIISNFEGNVYGNTIDNQKYYEVLREACNMLNNALKHININNEEECIQNFIDAVLELYYYTELTEGQITDSISKSLDNFTSKGNDDLKNLKFEIYTFRGKESYDSLDYINERLENDYYTT